MTAAKAPWLVRLKCRRQLTHSITFNLALAELAAIRLSTADQQSLAASHAQSFLLLHNVFHNVHLSYTTSHTTFSHNVLHNVLHNLEAVSFSVRYNIYIIIYAYRVDHAPGQNAHFWMRTQLVHIRMLIYLVIHHANSQIVDMNHRWIDPIHKQPIYFIISTLPKLTTDTHAEFANVFDTLPNIFGKESSSIPTYLIRLISSWCN